MAAISSRLMQTVVQCVADAGDPAIRFLDVKGRCLVGDDPLGKLTDHELRRNYAIQESINRGEPFLYYVVPSIMTWVLALEDQRVIGGSLAGGEFLVEEDGEYAGAASAALLKHGIQASVADRFLAGLTVSTRDRLAGMAGRAQAVFYRESGWQPVLLDERNYE